MSEGRTIAMLGLGTIGWTVITRRVGKEDATTPGGGCTIAGIPTLEDGRLRSVLARAVETAARVAGELGA